jgi:hypothetical protein
MMQRLRHGREDREPESRDLRHHRGRERHGPHGLREFHRFASFRRNSAAARVGRLFFKTPSAGKRLAGGRKAIKQRAAVYENAN